jgi:hypothetical protein
MGAAQGPAPAAADERAAGARAAPPPAPPAPRGARAAPHLAPPPPFAPAGAADSGVGVHPVTLAFRAPEAEAGYLREVSKWRAPVLASVFVFDCLAFSFRIAAKLAGRGGDDAGGGGLDVGGGAGGRLQGRRGSGGRALRLGEGRSAG